MTNKPDKFGKKFRMAVDVKAKYLFNNFPYVGKDESRRGDVSVPTDVVIKLMMPLLKKGHNATSDNYFTFLDLCLQLAKQVCSLAGMIRSNGRVIPNNLQETCSLQDTTIVKLADAAIATVSLTISARSQNPVTYQVYCTQTLPFRRRIARKRNPKLFFFTTKLRWESMFLTKCQDATLRKLEADAGQSMDFIR